MGKEFSVKSYIVACSEYILNLYEKGEISKEEAIKRCQLLLTMAPTMLFTEMVIPKLQERLSSFRESIIERIKMVKATKETPTPEILYRNDYVEKGKS